MTVWQAIFIQLFLVRMALGLKGMWIVIAVTLVVCLANAEFRSKLYGAFIQEDI